MSRTAAPRSPFAEQMLLPGAIPPLAGPPWLERLRAEALARFAELGLPTPRDEAWKQTNIAPLAQTPFRRASSEARVAPRDLERSAFAELGLPRIACVNGVHAPGLCAGKAPGRAWLGSLAAALRSRPAEIEAHLAAYADGRSRSFTALNTALLEDGAAILVPPDTVLEEPLHVLHLSSAQAEPAVSCPRTLVVIGANSRVRVVETYLGARPGAHLTNAVTEMAIGENASVSHVRIQDEEPDTYHLAAFHARLARDSRLVSVNVSFGARLARNDLGVVLDGEGAECTLDGLHVTDGERHVDHHTTLDHARPHGVSHELFKGILAGSSRAVFNGRIVVRPGAQKTDAKQSNRNLLLSGEAVVHTRPQLEIYADDVKCTHGATIGHLDADALFYLRSRGLSPTAARHLLIHAFAAGVLRKVELERLRTALESRMMALLLPALDPGAAR